MPNTVFDRVWSRSRMTKNVCLGGDQIRATFAFHFSSYALSFPPPPLLSPPPPPSPLPLCWPDIPPPPPPFPSDPPPPPPNPPLDPSPLVLESGTSNHQPGSSNYLLLLLCKNVGICPSCLASWSAPAPAGPLPAIPLPPWSGGGRGRRRRAGAEGRPRSPESSFCIILI